MLFQVMILTIGLAKQAILPNRKRKGNLLNVLFLLYIGVIESVRDFEHRNFKMADLLQNRLVRKGLMLVTFLLYFLTSFEQPAFSRALHHEPVQVECSYQSSSRRLSYRRCIKDHFVPVRLNAVKDFSFPINRSLKLAFASSKRYLQIRRLLI
ncbi:hypothetical protein [Flavisolibacter ginsenosidimutans]|uniref:Uncharacterized protein n=1 Tax=Flavisolibacter ginsenosidimutans TaxID=661481 RepID=A0A5B8UGB1_9BACT|nr:hypothetical protein [Flavisolibacter ginsenosidimutans]QEC55701.1 hypothetical protein FSB75_07275 [Flavisolibacter ginsenosidimutans]